jgi:hypothetical protein
LVKASLDCAADVRNTPAKLKPRKKTDPGLGDDPLAEAGRTKPRADFWQTDLVKTA